MTKKQKVDVAIIGAGSAGLYTLPPVRNAGLSYLMMDGGELGTTCARVGCMPSKAAIHIAYKFHSRKSFEKSGIEGGESLSVDMPAALARVRSLRDRLTSGVKGRMAKMGEQFLPEHARFIAPNVLQAGEHEITAEKIVIATGSKPFVPDIWSEFADHILTTDDLFEQTDLPENIAVIGLGAIGLELGQTLARWGVNVHGFDMQDNIGGIEDYVVQATAKAILEKDFPMTLGHAVSLQKQGHQIQLSAGETQFTCDKVLVCIGRKPNLESLDLGKAGIELNEKGLPDFDPETMQIKGHPVFIAGDVDADRPLLHEAADEGRIAGYNCVSEQIESYIRKPPMGIIFTDPNIAIVGAGLDTLDENEIAIGEFDFSHQGRAIVMGVDHGVLRVYAEEETGKLLGGCLVAPGGEHIAQLLMLAVQQGMTAYDMLQFAFYHPVLEEGLQNALYDVLHEVEAKREKPYELSKRR